MSQADERAFTNIKLRLPWEVWRAIQAQGKTHSRSGKAEAYEILKGAVGAVALPVPQTEANND